MIGSPATVVSVNISPGGIPKRPVELAEITIAGLRGDGHNHPKHSTPLQAVSVIDMEDLNDLIAEGFDVYPGATGENLTVRGLSVDNLHIGDRLRLYRASKSTGVVLELTKVRKPCYVLDSISPRLKLTIEGRCGFLARVVCEGDVRPGDSIEVQSSDASSVSSESMTNDCA